MLLCVDIGNTNITLGLYKDLQLGPRWRLATTHERMPDEFGVQLLGLLDHKNILPEEVDCAVIASVVPQLTERWVQVCKTYLGCTPLVVDADTPTGVEILIDNPQSVGADRIVDAVAVHNLYGGPACIVDFGTATTFDAISEQGNYLGGAIAPGIGIAADALSQRTAKLPRVDIAAPPNPIGRNTVHAIQSGLLFGYIGLVEGMVKRFRSELGQQMKTIATGGLAEMIADHTEVLEIIAPWLTLDGLQLIYKYNRNT